MKSIKALLISTASVLFLIMTGCVTDSQVIEKTSYVHIPIGTVLTSEITPPPLPDHATYVNASYEDRCTILTDYVANLLKTTRDLNDRLDAIAKLDVENQAIVDKQNQAENDRVNKLVGDTVKQIKGK